MKNQQLLLGCTHRWLTIHLSPFALMRGRAWQRQRAPRCYKYVQQVVATLTTRPLTLRQQLGLRARA
eukprot:1152572-Pelagomonas_calceolata.AAC.2